MKGKNKVTAILAILMLTISIFAAFPTPVQAQPPPYPLVTFFDQITAPSFPMNLNWTHPENKSMLGATIIGWVYLIPNSTVMNVSSITVGFNITNPAAIEVIKDLTGAAKIFPVSPAPGLLPKTIFEDQLYAGNATWVPGSYNVMSGELSPSTFALNTSKVPYVTVPAAGAPVFYIAFRIKWWGESWITPTTVTILDENGNPYPVIIYGGAYDGHYKMRRVFVELSAEIQRDPSDKIGDNFLMIMSLSNTEPMNNWSATIMYNTSLLSCNGVLEGPYFQVLGTSTTFTSDLSTPGVITASCDEDTGLNRDGEGVLMYINFTTLNYTDTVPFTSQLVPIISFQPRDSNGTLIALSNSDPAYPNPKPGYFEFNKLVYLVLVGPEGSPITSWTCPEHGPCETFNYYLYIKDCSQKVHSWKAGFRYNPHVVDCVSFTPGPYLSDIGNTTCTGGAINHTTGVVESLNCTLDDPDAYATGDGLLAIITFHIEQYGRTVIDLTDTDNDTCEAKLEDINGNEIVSGWPRGLYLVDGIFEVRCGAVFKFPYIQTYPDVCTNFTVDLKIYTLEKVCSWQTGFYFDPDVLECTGITFGNLFSTVSHGDITGIIDNIEGKVYGYGQYITAEDTYVTAPGAGKILLSATFHVKGLGWSLLCLTDTPGDPCESIAIDINGDEIPLGFVDGLKRTGDVSGGVGKDNMVTGLDVLTVTAKANFMTAIYEADDPNADVSCDGMVTGLDALTITSSANFMKAASYPYSCS